MTDDHAAVIREKLYELLDRAGADTSETQSLFAVSAALDRLLAERDAAREDTQKLWDSVEREVLAHRTTAARAEAAEAERDDALLQRDEWIASAEIDNRKRAEAEATLTRYRDTLEWVRWFARHNEHLHTGYVHIGRQVRAVLDGPNKTGPAEEVGMPDVSGDAEGPVPVRTGRVGGASTLDGPKEESE